MASRGDEELVYMAMQTGAWGYVAKEAGRQVLIETIKAAYSGEVMVLPFLAHLALQGAFALSQVPAVRAEPLLSALEVRMLRLMEQGVPPTAIGSRLHLSQQELSAHLRGVFAKLPLSPDLRAATTTLRRKLCAD
jgi:DNA-binding NarL/FixJ family response regulator